jgi:hypothetical protein
MTFVDYYLQPKDERSQPYIDMDGVRLSSV